MSKQVALFDFGDTLVQYYRPSDFPAILTTCIQRVRSYLEGIGPLGVSEEVVRERTSLEDFEAPDARVRPLEARLANIFGLHPDALSRSQQLAMCREFTEPIFAIASRYADTLPTLQSLRERGYRIGIISNTSWGSPAELW